MAELVLIYDSVTGGFISKQVGADHIANAAIVSAKVASGAIGGAHLANAAIVSALIASGAIGSSHLGYAPGGGLASGDHAALLHLSGQIGSGQLAADHIVAGAITSAKVGTNVLATPHFANQGILSASLGAAVIAAPHIAAAGVLSGQVGSGQIGTFHFIDGAIVSSKVGAGVLGGAHLANAAILSAQVASGAIGSSHLGFTMAAGLLSGDHSTLVHTSGQVGSGQIANIHLAVRSRERLTTALANRFTVPGWYADGQQTTIVTANWLYYLPIYVPSLFTYTGIICQVTTGASGITGRLGIYNWSGGGPGALALDAGTVLCSGTGSKEITISQALDAGWYFLTFICNGAPTLRTMDALKAASPPHGGIENTAGDMPWALGPVASGRTNDTLSGLVSPAPAPNFGVSIASIPTIWLREV